MRSKNEGEEESEGEEKREGEGESENEVFASKYSARVCIARKCRARKRRSTLKFRVISFPRKKKKKTWF
jgi:hypothetical protein